MAFRLGIQITTLFQFLLLIIASMASKIAVVTGGNKGIGYEIVGKLAENGYKTILAARDRKNGPLATSTFVSKGYDVEFRYLDISLPDSIVEFCAGLDADYGKCDVLVNNAAIAFKGSDPTPFTEQVEPTINVNFFGTLNVIKNMLPILRKADSARIVNVSSQAGLLRILPSKERRDFFQSPLLTVEELESAMTEFVQDVKSGNHKEKGWPNSCYGTSKLGVTALTKVLARAEPSLIINACCPGYCKTDMSSHRGTKTAEEGARTPAMLAMLPAGSYTGEFVVDEEVSEW